MFVNLVYQISAKSLLQCLPKGSIDPVLDEEDKQVEGGDCHLPNQGHNARALTKTKVDTQTFWKSGNIIIKLGSKFNVTVKFIIMTGPGDIERLVKYLRNDIHREKEDFK